MAIRVLADGSFSCDTPAEAIAMRDLMMDRKTRDARREARRTGRSEPTAMDPETNKGTATLVSVLCNSPDGISSDELAQRLGKTARSLPPLMVALKRRVRAKGHDLSDVLIRERVFDSNNRPISKYKLTPEGVKLLIG
jgi:triphosphoribosyl-dephospho-CoA synthetase